MLKISANTSKVSLWSLLLASMQLRTGRPAVGLRLPARPLVSSLETTRQVVCSLRFDYEFQIRFQNSAFCVLDPF